VLSLSGDSNYLLDAKNGMTWKIIF